MPGIEESKSGDWDADLSSLEVVQRRHIRHVLKVVNDNKAQAAEILGIARPTLYRILAKDGVLGESEVQRSSYRDKFGDPRLTSKR